MKKGLALFFVVVSVFCFSQSFAAPWAVVATYADVDRDHSSGTIHTVDLGASPPTVYGPFLEYKLGSGGGGLFDIVMVPGQRYALITNFGDSTMHRIDLKDPKNPVWAGKIDIPFFAEDIACTPDGKLALVTDGGFSAHMAFIDLETFKLKSNFYLGDRSAQSVAVAPNNSTVLFVDYFYAKVHYGTINKLRNGLTNMGTIYLCAGTASKDPVTGNDRCDNNDLIGRPVNITISPNGKTAIAAISNAGFVAAFEINDAGQAVAGDPLFIGGFGGTWDNSSTSEDDQTLTGLQSIAFQSDAKAYALHVPRAYQDPDNASHWIRRPMRLTPVVIEGPGKVKFGDNASTELLLGGTSQLFGVDTAAIAGWQAVVGNPTMSGAQTGKMSYANLHTKTFTELKLNNNGIAVGVALKYY
jgi:hypothetical protein